MTPYRASTTAPASPPQKTFFAAEPKPHEVAAADFEDTGKQEIEERFHDIHTDITRLSALHC